jgi:lipoprotein-releasing system permease protein
LSKKKITFDVIVLLISLAIQKIFGVDLLMSLTVCVFIITLIELFHYKIVSHLTIIYLRRKKIVLLSIAAVAVSVALMLVVDSLFTGYIDALRQMTLADTGDISFWPRGGTVEDVNVFLDELQSDPNVIAAAPFLMGSGLLHTEGGIVREVGVYGIDPARETGFADWKQKLLRQKDADPPRRKAAGEVSPKADKEPDFSVPDYNDAPGVWLGINVIAEPNENTDEYDFDSAQQFIGKRIILTTIGYEAKRHVDEFRISDIAFTQTFFGDKTLYMPYEQFYKIWYGENSNRPSFIKVKLKKGVDPLSMVGPIQKMWNDFAIDYLKLPPENVPRLVVHMSQDWYADVFEDLRNQKAIVLLIFGVICSVGVLLIFCIFYMIVTAKQKDIAIIKSCGASNITAASIFAGFGIVAGIVGSAAGVILGIIITKNVNILEQWVRVIFGLKLWRTSSYGLAEIPHQVHWASAPLFAILAIAGCLVGVLIPSLIAAWRSPVKILRYE